MIEARRRVMSVCIRGGVLLGLLALSAACSNEAAPTMPLATTGVFVPPAAPVFIEPGSYQFSAPLSPYPVSDYTITSKYVLFESGAFFLQLRPGGHEIAGTYRSENGYIEFQFTGSQWGATGTVTGDMLEVRYNDWAFAADFENAVYKRIQ